MGVMKGPSSGVWLMVAAMLILPAVDVLAKLLSQDLSPIQISFLRVTVQAVLLMIVMRKLPRLHYPWPLTRRLVIAACLVNMAITAMIWALAYLPVANAVALFFVEPLLVMLLSAVILREPSSLVKYMLAFTGLVGAMIVIRPNWVLYGWHTLLPVCAALCYALYLVQIRALGGQIAAVPLQAYLSLVGAVLLLLTLLIGQSSGIKELSWLSVSAAHWRYILALGAVSALTYWLISWAFTLSQASVLAPFRYLEIIGATMLGYWVFDEYPDALTWVGSGVILVSGLAVIFVDRHKVSVPTRS